MSPDLIGAFLRAALYVAFGLAVIGLAEVIGRRRFKQRMNERKSTINARRG